MAVSVTTASFDNDIIVIAEGTASEVLNYMTTGTYPMKGRHGCLLSFSTAHDGTSMVYSVLYISYS